MQVGMIGLGRMGLHMARRLARGGHEVVAYNRSSGPLEEARKFGIASAVSLEDLVKKLRPPRVVWIMLPAGKVTEEKIAELAGLLERGDTLVDGGNTFYKDDSRRAGRLLEKSIHYLDVGTSGGIWGLEKGYCLMIGGEKEIFERFQPIFAALAPPDGYGYMGPHGAGHFVKMIHNGIEYGLMQAYGEGFEILERSPYQLDPAKIARLWNQGSVVRSWLLELAEGVLQKDPKLKGFDAFVEDSGEGRWALEEAIEAGVPAPAISSALFARFGSRDKDSFALRLLAALRGEFGGHTARKPGRSG